MVREKVVYECKCDKCGYEWITKKAEIPKVCSKCKSIKWNGFTPPSVTIEVPQGHQVFGLAGGKAIQLSHFCQDCNDPCDIKQTRCEGCQSEFDYERSLKELE